MGEGLSMRLTKPAGAPQVFQGKAPTPCRLSLTFPVHQDVLVILGRGAHLTSTLPRAYLLSVRISLPSRSTLFSLALVGTFAAELFAITGCVYYPAESEVFAGPAPVVGPSLTSVSMALHGYYYRNYPVYVYRNRPVYYYGGRRYYFHPRRYHWRGGYRYYY